MQTKPYVCTHTLLEEKRIAITFESSAALKTPLYPPQIHQSTMIAVI